MLIFNCVSKIQKSHDKYRKKSLQFNYFLPELQYI